MSTALPPAWARGYSVERLREITSLFAAHDQGLIHGAFGRYREIQAANDLAAGRLHLYPETGRPQVAWVGYRTTSSVPGRDFTGTVRTRIPAGTYYVPRMAWSREPVELVAALLDEPSVAVWAWQEHAAERALVSTLGLSVGPVKISAASEMRGLYLAEPGDPIDPADVTTIGRIGLEIPDDLRQAVVDRYLGRSFADHYSGYNRASSWAALSLRGYWPDPERIEKPAEMSKRWKADNADALDLSPVDTPEMSDEVRAVLDLIPAEGFDRVRLMRLAPGGGELTRHADITDPDAGATPGRVARLHIPLVTNPDVVFRMWDLDGRLRRLHMAPGSAYYLDTRKPHTAVNGGAAERIHLVADSRVGGPLRDLIAAVA